MYKRQLLLHRAGKALAENLVIVDLADLDADLEILVAVEPVSYTHLDVYKRQVLASVFPTARGLPSAPSTSAA